jgi:large subunit ribosomal protein L28
MARIRRKLSTAKPQFGNYKPFSQKRTRRQFRPNMQNKRVYVPELGRSVRIRVSTSELKTIDKIGLREFVKQRGISLKQLVD